MWSHDCVKFSIWKIQKLSKLGDRTKVQPVGFEQEMPERMVDRLTAIEACTSPSKLLELGEALLRELGIVAYSYVHLPPFGVDKLQITVPVGSRNFTPEFMKIYGEKQWFRIDPFIKHAMRSSSVVKWSTIERLEENNPQLREFFDTMAATVKGDGLSVAAYGPNNSNGYFAMATGLDVIDFPKESLTSIQTVCQALHVRYCQLAARQREICGLSPREIEVMKLVVRGQKSADIAKKMDVSTHTVNTYLKRAFEKLDVTDRVSAAMQFLALGYLYA